MTRDEFLKEVDALLELEPGTLSGPELLEDLEDWNSLAVVSFLALADTNNGTQLSPRDVRKCLTVADLLELAKVSA